MIACIAWSIVVFAGVGGVASERGDTSIRQGTAKTMSLSGSWTLDGTKISIVSHAGTPAPYSLQATDSLVPTPGAGKDSIFLRLGTTPEAYPPVIVREQNDSIWWCVKGKTGSWALEMDSSFAWYTIAGMDLNYFVYINGVRFRWARIHDGQPWVRWIDTLYNPESWFGSTAATWNGLLHGLGNTAVSLDTLYGEVRPYHGIVWPDTSIHFRADIALASSDTGHPFCSRSISDRSKSTASGDPKKAILGPFESLRAKTSFSWWTSDPKYNDSTYNWRATIWDTTQVVWKFRIGSITDSVVSIGLVPQYIGYDDTKAIPDPLALVPRSPLRPGLRSPVAVDPRGRRILSRTHPGSLHDLLRRGDGFDLSTR